MNGQHEVTRSEPHAGAAPTAETYETILKDRQGMAFGASMLESGELTSASLREKSSGRAIDDGLPEWPPDILALAHVILQRSEAHRFALSPPKGRSWPPTPSWASDVAAEALLAVLGNRTPPSEPRLARCARAVLRSALEQRQARLGSHAEPAAGRRASVASITEEG
jgi:hypothetical protein